MVEESLLKSHFIGRDGFRWWVGQIAPTSAWQAQADGGGWGHRYKVRILGYHPYNTSELSDEDLPWAGVLMPTTAGSGGAQFAQSAQVAQGDVVVGFFLDGDNAQIPMIMGSFGKTLYTPSTEYSNPFAPFTGFTSKIKRPDGQRDTRESTGQSTEDQKLQRNLNQQHINELNSSKGPGQAREIQASLAAGQTVTHADTCSDSFFPEVTGVLDSLIRSIGQGGNFFGDVQNAAKKIQNLTNNFVGTIFNSLYTKLIPILQTGLDILYKKVYAAVLAATQNPFLAHLAGVKAQEAMVPPVRNLEDQLLCTGAKVVNNLGSEIKGLVDSTIMEVANFGSCTAEQFCGSLLNSVIDQATSGLGPSISGVSKILTPGFSLDGFLRSSSDIMSAVQGFFHCNQTGGKCPAVKQWTVGYGPKDRANANLDNIMSNANVSNSNNLSNNSPYTNPGCASPSSCGGPKVTFFGGNGSGGSGRAVLGSVVSNSSSGNSSSVARTASVIGVEITDPGSGYTQSPPMVVLEDSCGLGYGAVGRAVVDFNSDSPTFGQITGVYMPSEGENYPVDEIAGTGENMVTGTAVVYPGSGYSPEDTATDDNGTNYSLTVDGGRIIQATPINNLRVDSSPNIQINTETGTGAIIKPFIGTFVPPATEVVSVIDCVS